MDVGIRELKKHLSDYIERASRGEYLRVTSRGKPVAALGPLPGIESLDRGIEEGWVDPGSGERPRPVQRARSSERIDDVLGEDRGR